MTSFVKLKSPVNGQNMDFTGVVKCFARHGPMLPKFSTDIGVINVRSTRGNDPGISMTSKSEDTSYGNAYITIF